MDNTRPMQPFDTIGCNERTLQGLRGLIAYIVLFIVTWNMGNILELLSSYNDFVNRNQGAFDGLRYFVEPFLWVGLFIRAGKAAYDWFHSWKDKRTKNNGNNEEH